MPDRSPTNRKRPRDLNQRAAFTVAVLLVKNLYLNQSR